MSKQNQNKNQFSTALAKVNDTYFPMIERQLEGNNIKMDDYSKQCVINALSSINETMDKQGVTWNDPQLDQSNITQILLNVASLKLNAAANPNEVYFQVRNVKTKVNNKDVWKKQIEMGIEGDGNDAILSRFGRDVKTVHQYWLVRENDDFEYPTYNGLEMTPPKWSPRGTGDVIRVVYPIEKTNNVVEYHIAEREDVIRNLIAHINNNLMNETFGIAKNRWNATAEQRKQIDEKKKEIVNRVEELGLMNALDDEELQKYISPAWKDPQSRESMLIRKMRNNVVKRVPKDFGNTFVQHQYDEATDETYEEARKEIAENANKEMIDFDEVEDVEYTQVNDQNIDAETGEVIEREKVEKTNKTEPEEVIEPEQEKELTQKEIEQQELFGNDADKGLAF